MSKIKLTKKEIKNLGFLSKIKLTEEELEKFTGEMQTIISSVETLEDFKKTKDVQFEEIDFDELREDKIKPSMQQKDVLANAPEQENGYFKVYGDIFNEDNS